MRLKCDGNYFVPFERKQLCALGAVSSWKEISDRNPLTAYHSDSHQIAELFENVISTQFRGRTK